MKIILTVLCFLFIFPRSAHAYIDPASGSIIISAVISAIVAVSVTVRTYWSKIVKVFKGTASDKEDEKSRSE